MRLFKTYFKRKAFYEFNLLEEYFNLSFEEKVEKIINLIYFSSEKFYFYIKKNKTTKDLKNNDKILRTIYKFLNKSFLDFDGMSFFSKVQFKSSSKEKLINEYHNPNLYIFNEDFDINICKLKKNSTLIYYDDLIVYFKYISKNNYHNTESTINNVDFVKIIKELPISISYKNIIEEINKINNTEFTPKEIILEFIEKSIYMIEVESNCFDVFNKTKIIFNEKDKKEFIKNQLTNQYEETHESYKNRKYFNLYESFQKDHFNFKQKHISEYLDLIGSYNHINNDILYTNIKNHFIRYYDFQKVSLSNIFSPLFGYHEDIFDNEYKFSLLEQKIIENIYTDIIELSELKYTKKSNNNNFPTRFFKIVQSEDISYLGPDSMSYSYKILTKYTNLPNSEMLINEMNSKENEWAINKDIKIYDIISETSTYDLHLNYYKVYNSNILNINSRLKFKDEINLSNLEICFKNKKLQLTVKDSDQNILPVNRTLHNWNTKYYMLCHRFLSSYLNNEYYSHFKTDYYILHQYYTYIPEIKYKSIILKFRSWKITNKIDNKSKLKSYLLKWVDIKKVFIQDNSQFFYLNLEDSTSLDMILNFLKNKTHIIIIENKFKNFAEELLLFGYEN